MTNGSDPTKLADRLGAAMRESRVIQIVGWRKTQHYKLRNPPWVKWHVELLDRHDLAEMSNSDLGVYGKLLLLASRFRNRIVLDERVLLRRYGITRKALANCERLGLILIVDQSAVDDEIDAESTSGEHQTPVAIHDQHSPDAQSSAEEKSSGIENQHVSSNSASKPLAACKRDACSEERDLLEGEENRNRKDSDSEGTAPVSNVSSNKQTNRQKLTELLSDKEITPLKSPYRESRRSRNADFDIILDRVERYVVEHSLKGPLLDIDDHDTRRGMAKVIDCTETQIDTAIQQLKDRKRLPLERRRSNGASKP